MTTHQSPVGAPLARMSVSGAMRPGVVTCLAADGVPEIASIMVRHGIHAVVLASEHHAAPLIVTDRELVRAALQRKEARASEIACEPVVSLPVDAPLDEAVAMMARQYVSHVLVTDRSGAAAGIVSSFDAMAVLAGRNPRYARRLVPAPARPSLSARTLGKARAGDAMHPGIATCAAEASLDTVVRAMADHRVHCVAIAGVEQPGHHLTWGLIDDMDLMLAAHRGALDGRAATIAATEPIAVGEDESLERAAALMVEHDTSHVVVVGRSGFPAGMISTLNVASVLAVNA